MHRQTVGAPGRPRPRCCRRRSRRPPCGRPSAPPRVDGPGCERLKASASRSQVASQPVRIRRASPLRISTPSAFATASSSSGVITSPAGRCVDAAMRGHVEQHAAGDDRAHVVDRVAGRAARGHVLGRGPTVVERAVAEDVAQRVHVRGAVGVDHEDVLGAAGTGALRVAVQRDVPVLVAAGPDRSFGAQRDRERVDAPVARQPRRRGGHLGRDVVERAALVLVAPLAPVPRSLASCAPP